MPAACGEALTGVPMCGAKRDRRRPLRLGSAAAALARPAAVAGLLAQTRSWPAARRLQRRPRRSPRRRRRVISASRSSSTTRPRSWWCGAMPRKSRASSKPDRRIRSIGAGRKKVEPFDAPGLDDRACVHAVGGGGCRYYLRAACSYEKGTAKRPALFRSARLAAVCCVRRHRPQRSRSAPPRPPRLDCPGAQPACPYVASSQAGQRGGGVLRFPQTVVIGAGRPRLRRRPVLELLPQVFDAARKFLLHFGLRGLGPGELGSVGAIAVAADCPALRGGGHETGFFFFVVGGDPPRSHSGRGGNWVGEFHFGAGGVYGTPALFGRGGPRPPR